MRGKGFTLIEVLVAATIIAVLTAIGIVSYTRINMRSRDSKRKSDMEQIRSGLEMYRADTGSYPSTGGGSGWTNADNLKDATDTNGNTFVQTYMAAIPVDPKSPTLFYRYQATNFVSAKYYGYCLSSFIESEDPVDTCTPDTVNNHNYGLKSP